MSNKPKWTLWVLHRLIDEGMNRVQLAKAAGVSPAYLSETLAGRKTGSAKIVNKISKALELNADDSSELGTLAARDAGYNVREFVKENPHG